MKVKTERCWSGNSNWSYRLTLSDGCRCSVTVDEGEDWNRSIASNALDLLEINFGVDRANVRFDHH